MEPKGEVGAALFTKLWEPLLAEPRSHVNNSLLLPVEASRAQSGAKDFSSEATKKNHLSGTR